MPVTLMPVRRLLSIALGLAAVGFTLAAMTGTNGAVGFQWAKIEVGAPYTVDLYMGLLGFHWCDHNDDIDWKPTEADLQYLAYSDQNGKKQHREFKDSNFMKSCYSSGSLVVR
ncbi:hypothetical protein AAMO2058_001242200, partial [Amorphochlora amoebiformis]